MDHALDKYIRLFQRINVSHRQGEKAPHKAVLLLTVMSLIESGDQKDRRIEFSDILKERFKAIWTEYIGDSRIFNPEVAMPFWYLKNESEIWRLIPINNEVSHQLLRSTTASSLQSIRCYVKHAEIPEDLFELFSEPFARVKLAEVLFEEYILV